MDVNMATSGNKYIVPESQTKKGKPTKSEIIFKSTFYA